LRRIPLSFKLLQKANLPVRLMLRLLLLTFLACEMGCGGATPTPTIAKPTVRIRPTEPPTPTKLKPTPTLYPTPNPALIDSDGDLFPNEVEVGMGSDPFVHDCLRKAGCEGPNVITPSGIMNVLLVLDASAGMDGEIEGKIKMELTKTALTQYAHDLLPGVNAGLIVYGHRGSTAESDKEQSCASVELTYPIGPIDRVTLYTKINSVVAVGWSPVASALQAAGKAFAGKEKQTNQIVLISSVGDTCGGDPCRVAGELRQAYSAITIHVIGLTPDDATLRQDQDTASQQFQCVADTTGGTYYNVRTASEFAQAWKAILDRDRQWFSTSSCLMQHKDFYESCRWVQLSAFEEWSESSGWALTHGHEWVEIQEAVAEEEVGMSMY
jgi:hypothetical protein